MGLPAPDNYSKINNACLVILAGFAITVALIYTRPILVPFAFSVFFYAVISPMIRWFKVKLNIPKAVSVILTIFLFLVISSFVLYFISNSIQSFIRSTDAYRAQVIQFVEYGTDLANTHGVAIDKKSIVENVKELPFFKVATNLTGGVASIVGNIILIILFVLFLIAGESTGEMKNNLLIVIHQNITRYASTKFLTSLATGALSGIVLAFCGVKLAFMFGVLSFLLNFIPNFGSIIAVALPLPVILLQFGLGWQLPVGLGLPAVIQFSIGNVLEPKIMGHGLDLHPVTVLIFLMFWGLVWGLPGMFLAVPITAIIKIVFNRIETTRALSELLAGRLPS